jgi:ABC-type Fe3+/spermidine/putrescine transport system ATPase subunit
MKIHDLNLRFDPKGIAGIYGVTLSLLPLENLVIMGPNGAGKTTLLKIIHGELKAESGKLEVPKTYFLKTSDSGTEEKVLDWLMKMAAAHTPEQALQQVRDEAMRLEFTGSLEKKMSSLSSGQYARVQCAAALLSKCELLLMDEPFIHVPEVERNEIMSWIKELQHERQLTLIWVTHDHRLALRFSDRIALMNHGKIIKIDPPLKLFNQPPTPEMARFLGHKNLFPLEQIGPSTWMSPLGLIKNEAWPDKKFLLMSVDRSALDFNLEGNLTYEMGETTFMGSFYEVHLKVNQANLLIQLDPFELKTIKAKKTKSLTLRSQEITLLDCLS